MRMEGGNPGSARAPRVVFHALVEDSERAASPWPKRLPGEGPARTREGACATRTAARELRMTNDEARMATERFLTFRIVMRHFPQQPCPRRVCALEGALAHARDRRTSRRNARFDHPARTHPGPREVLFRREAEVVHQGRDLRAVCAGCGRAILSATRRRRGATSRSCRRWGSICCASIMSRRDGFWIWRGSFGLRVLISIPWAEHVEFLNNPKIRRQVVETIRSGVAKNKGHDAIFGYFVGNEIPTQHGALARRAARAGVCREADPRRARRRSARRFIATRAIRPRNICCRGTSISAPSTSISSGSGILKSISRGCKISRRTSR